MSKSELHALATPSRRELLAGGAGLFAGGLLGARGLPLSAQTPPPRTPLPERFDISDLMGPVKDQGERMTCAAFAFVAAAEAAIARDTGRRVMLSEEYLFHMSYAGAPRPADESTAAGDLINIAVKHGFARAEDWPYQPNICPSGSQEPGCPVFPTDLAAVQRNVVRLPDITSDSVTVGFSGGGQDRPDPRQRGIADLIARRRIAPIFASVIPEDRQGWGDDGVLSVPDIVEGLSSDEATDLPMHFAVLTGYDFARREFYFKNSWGTGCGRDGYGTIPFALIDSVAFSEILFPLVDIRPASR